MLNIPSGLQITYLILFEPTEKCGQKQGMLEYGGICQDALNVKTESHSNPVHFLWTDQYDHGEVENI